MSTDPPRDPFHRTGNEIAVVGLAGRFPGARDVESFWQNLAAGVESIRDLSDEDLDAAGVPPAERALPGYVPRAAWLDDVELFDAGFFGFTPREAELMDPQQRLFLECAWEALETAGYDARQTAGPVGVFAGGKMGTYIFNLTSNPDLAALGTVTLGLGNDIGLLAMRTAYKLDLAGPAYFLQTACSTGLVAVHLASQSLLLDECRMALAGSVAIDVPNRRGYVHQPDGILSADGHVRPFDAEASGTVFGSGLGVVVLKRLHDALEDGDRIWAVIKGTATNNDGAHKPNFTAPSVDGQADVILHALVNAEVSPETISYVEAHGTGTNLGDPVEIRALTKAWRRLTDRTGFCALGSVKSNVGHLDAAAGISGLIKTILALDRELIPPSLHFETPNPRIDFAATPFRVASRPEPWPSTWETTGAPRRAAVSAFGFGGTNAHVVLEEAPPRREAGSAADRPAGAAARRRMLVLSARSREALEAATDRLADHLESHPELALDDVAWTLQVGRRTFPWRRTAVADPAADLAEAAAALRERSSASVVTGRADSAERRVAFLFSGQGAQYAGMALGLAAAEPAFRERLDLCAEILRPHLQGLPGSPGGGDLRRILAGEEAGGGDLSDTALAQPALFAVEYALASLLMDRGVMPSALLGHSIGEYVAACLAGVFAVEDALALVAARGRLMAEMPRGAMLALWMGEEETTRLLASSGIESEIGLAAVNGRERTVVSGPTEAIDVLEAELGRRGLRGRRLHTSHAFHSPMMAPAAERFRAEVARARLRAPVLPFVSNVTGTWIRPEQATDPGYWAEHLLRPVRFAAGLDAVTGAGGDGELDDPVLLEVGPGNALTTLANAHLAHLKREDGPAAVASMRHPDDPRPDDAVLLGAIGRLFTLGVRLDPHSLFADVLEGDESGEPSVRRPRRVPLPTYPFERQRYWVDADPTGLAGQGAGRRAAGKEPDLSRWFYLPSWKSTLSPSGAPTGPSTGLPADEEDETFSGRSWWVFAKENEPGGLGEALARRLQASGSRVTVIDDRPGTAEPVERDQPTGEADRWIIDARRDAHYRRLVEVLGVPAGVIHLWSVGDEPPSGGDSGPDRFRVRRDRFRSWQDRGYYSLLSLTAALDGRLVAPAEASEGRPALALLAVSSRLHDVRGEGGAIPEKAPLLGACLVIPQEHQDVACRAIDLDPVGLAEPSATAERLLAEARELAAPPTGPRDVVIAWRGGRRLARSYERTPIGSIGETGSTPWRPRGVYVITGGLGAVGRVVAEHLARTVQARLVLAGRTELPGRDTWDAWCAERGADDPVSRKIMAVRELEAAGAEVEVAAVDVTDPRQVRALLEGTVARFGAIHGVFHLAGALAGDSIYRPLVVIGRASEEQFGPKAHALYALEEAIGHLEASGQAPDFCLLFSSNAAVLGGLGFAAYAAANAFVDAFAADRSAGTGTGTGRPGTRWIAAGWDEWPAQAIEVDVQTAMSELAMTAEEGGEALDRVLACGAGGHVVVATGDLDARLDLWVRRDPALVRRTGGSHARPELETDFEAPRNPLEERVAAIWQELLGIESVGIHDNFFDLGGHSLLATQLLSRLRQELGVEVELQSLFAAPTVAGVAAAAAEAGAESEAEPAVESGAQADTGARPGDGATAAAPETPPESPAAAEPEAEPFGELTAESPSQLTVEAPSELGAESPVEPRSELGPESPPETKSAPLSFAQERMWFLSQMDPESAAYNLLTPARLEGPLDLPALARAFNALVRRHGGLRTRFVAGADGETGSGAPTQVVEPRLHLSMPVVDLSALPADRREALASRLAGVVRAVPFDLGRGPLLRVVVLRLDRRDHALLLVMHHIVSDGWSMGVLITELGRLVETFAAGRPEEEAGLEPLPPEVTDAADFATWQRDHLRGETLERHLAYWRDRLAAPPPPLRLPTDRPRAVAGPQPFRAAVASIHLEPAAWQRVRELGRSGGGRSGGATPFMVVLAAFQALLHRWSGADDLVVGCPIAGRTRREVEGLVGCFLNTLVLRTRFDAGGEAHGESGSLSFRALLDRVAEASIGAFSHQDLPLETVLQSLFTEGRAARPAEKANETGGMGFFQTMFLFQNMPAPTLELGELTLSVLRPEGRVDLGSAIFDLCLAAEETDGRLALWMTYNAELFDGETVERMLDALVRMLEAAAEDPERPVDALPLLPEDERRRQIALGTEMEAPEMRPAQAVGVGGINASWQSIVKQIALRAARGPERPAVFAAPGERAALSYGELVRRANAVAGLLADAVRRAGPAAGGASGISGSSTSVGTAVGLEIRVGLCLERSPALVVAMLGVLRAGAAYVPLDPAYPESRSRAIVADAGAPVVITTPALAERFDGVAGVEVLTLELDGRPAAGSTPGARSAPGYFRSQPPAIEPESAAYVIYTSGSTGVPKGVVVEHRSLAAFAAAARERYPVGPNDRVLQFASISFDTSVEEIFPALSAGAALVLRDEEMLAGAGAFLDGCKRAGASVVDLPTAWFHELVAALEAEDLTLGPPIRLVILGGERVVPERLAAFRRRMHPSVRLLNTYGPTEATVVATASEPLADGSSWRAAMERADGRSGPPAPSAPPAEVPIGSPLPGVSAHVVDPRLEVAPPGVYGELVLGGAGLARGYLGRPAATAARFVPDPFADPATGGGARLYRTGDRARRLASGVLDFGGRIDVQLKVRGFRVEPGEIEACLRDHPSVEQAVVVARSEGGGPERLVAYVVPADGNAAGWTETARAAVRAAAEERLPAYMVPADFVALETLPLTPSGKVDRRALPAPAEEAGSGAARSGGADAPATVPDDFVPPETEAEQTVAAIFAAVLGLDPARRPIGAEDDFFRLGGHSLLLPQVLHRVRQAFRVEVPLRALYEEPTVAGLAALVEELILEELERAEPAP